MGVMSENTTSTEVKTRPDQLMPSGEEAHRALQGFLHIMGFHPGRVDGNFGDNSNTAYDQARDQYSFLPELGVNPDESAVKQVLQSIDNALQSDVAFQRQYVTGVQNADDTIQVQGALVAGGSWANRHLGDRISEAEAIEIDGERGVLTDRGVRNAATLTGVGALQSSLNLLIDADLRNTGIYDDETNQAIQRYAEERGLELTGDAQENFLTVQEYIQNNEGDALRSRVSEVLNSDEDYSAPDETTRDAQIVMNDLARQNGSNTRTAPDARQTDQSITVDNSHTRTVIAPEVNVDLEAAPVTEITVNPLLVDEMYQISRNDVLNEMSSIAEGQLNDPESAQSVLAYSEEANSYVLVQNLNGESVVSQISDRNVDDILSQVSDGSIALDNSAATVIAERLHGNNPDTTAYSTEDLRNAFVEDANRFTSDTRESLLTTTAVNADGTELRFGTDDLNDALDKLDSQSDWSDYEDPATVQAYIKELREAVEDAREERPVINPPDSDVLGLDTANMIEVDIGGETAQVPAEIWARISDQMELSESGFSQGADRSALAISSIDDLGPTPQANVLTSGFDAALAAQEPLQVDGAQPLIVAEDEPDVAATELATEELVANGTRDNVTDVQLVNMGRPV